MSQETLIQQSDSRTQNINKAEVMANAEKPHRDAAVEIGAVATEVGPEALLSAEQGDIENFANHAGEVAGEAYDVAHQTETAP